MNRGTRILLWTYVPTHHQTSFLQALRDDGIDLVVHYFKPLSAARLRLGWSDPDTLPPGERKVAPQLASLEACPDWRERIHIIPGYGALFLVRLALELSLQRVPWVNWCEPSRNSPRWYLMYPLKRFYAALINHYALGALAIGVLARQDFIRWGVDRDRIRFLPYSVAGLESREAAKRGSSDFPRFVFVGALCHRKGIDVLLKAFRSVAKLYPNARLRLVGSDESRGAYTTLAAELGIGNAVEFSGSVPAAQIASAIENCDVLVLPSRFDGWGMVVNEAASLGKGLIATEACGSAHHLVESGINGYRVAPDNANALADAMVEYCRDPRLAGIHGAASRRLFARFTPERNARRLRECLSSLSSPTEPGARWDAA